VFEDAIETTMIYTHLAPGAKLQAAKVISKMMRRTMMVLQMMEYGEDYGQFQMKRKPTM
jgi:hypothetical protein